MTHLRKMMLEELERRNYAQTTIHGYIQTMEDFARGARHRNGVTLQGTFFLCYPTAFDAVG